MSDRSLAEYVGGLLRQGYTEEQIRASLLQNGYPQSLVDATFRALGQGQGNAPAPATGQQPSSAAGQLASYLRTYLNQGYQVEQLRPYLLDQGYAASDVDAAIGAATGQPVIRHEVHMPGATVAKLALLLLIAAALVFGLLYFRGAFAGNGSPAPVSSDGSTPARLLDVRISLDKTTAAPGDKVNAQIEATNMGTSNGRYDVAFSYQLVDSAGTPIVAATTTRAITTSLSFNQPVTVPADAPEGSYTVEVSADYGGASPASASQQLTVQNAAAPQPSQNTTNETGPQPTGPPIVIVTDQSNPTDEATAAAKAGDSAKAEGICAGIKNQANHDQCLSLIAMTDEQVSHCTAIIGDEERDACYMAAILRKGDYSYCAKLVSPDKKQLCDNVQHIGTLENSTNTTQPATQPSIGSFAS